VGGRKYALRRLAEDGTAEAEIVGVGVPPSGDSNDRPLLVRLVKDGTIVGDEPLEVMRQRHLRARAELPLDALKMSRGEPVIKTVYPGAGEDAASPFRPSAEAPVASSVGEPIAATSEEL
jgi:nicotinate phosphoribosyltransferase